MASSNIEGALARQWQILKLLPSQGAGYSATQLTDMYTQEHEPHICDNKSKEYKALQRKMQRDLTMLERQGLVDRNDGGTPHGWKLRPNGRFLANQSPAEALFLTLAEKAIEPLVPQSLLKPLLPAFEQARKTLNESAKSKSRLKNKLINVRSVPLLPATINQSILETVHQALEENKVLEIDYRKSISPELKTYRLNLHGIMQRSPSVYLLATVGDYNNVLYFALHRIEAARLLTLSARASDTGMSALEKGNLYFGNNGSIQLELTANAITAQILSETPLASDQLITKMEGGDEETFTVTATVNDSWDLKFWLLSQGSNLTVVKPQQLRATIQEELSAALARYR